MLLVDFMYLGNFPLCSMDVGLVTVLGTACFELQTGKHKVTTPAPGCYPCPRLFHIHCIYNFLVQGEMTEIG